MNKILTILFLLFSIAAISQNKTIIPVGAVNNVNNNLGGVGSDSALYIPKSCGKPGDYMRYVAKKNAGYVVLDTCNSVLYGWSSIVNDFLPIGYPGQNSDCYGLINPGYVSWSGTGLTYDVTNAIYKINCKVYTSASGQVTSPTADPTNPRYDVVAVDTLGQIVIVPGDAAANPSIPQVDPAGQVYLTAIYIPAGATTPQITQLIIYDENTENFAGTTSGITLDLNNTTNPYHLTKAANVGNSSATRNITFTQNSGVTDSRDYSLMKLYIWLKQNMPTTATIRISFLNGTTVVSNVVTIGGNLGFSKLIDSFYQNVTIPMGAFTFTNPIFNKVRITLTGVQSGMYFDYVQLQNGILPPDIGNPYVTNYSSNATDDSTILTTSANQRFAASKGTTILSQGFGIQLTNQVNPADSFYKPNGYPTLASADTARLKQYFDQYYTNNTNPPDSAGFTFSVYSIDATPNFSYPTGTKVLVAASGTTGVFVGKENQVATLVGGVYSFTVPVSGDQLLVASTAQSFFFNGTVWIPQAIPDLVGGMNLGIPVPIGTKDNQSFVFKTHDTARIKIDSIGNTLLYQYAGLEDSNIYFKPGIGGKVDTGYFRQLIAGTGITITAGLNRTDTISSTGGGGGIHAVYSGYGLANVNDSTLKADTVTLSNYYLRLKDSLITYTTPTQVHDSLSIYYYPSTSSYIAKTAGYSSNGSTDGAIGSLLIGDGAASNLQTIQRDIFIGGGAGSPVFFAPNSYAISTTAIGVGAGSHSDSSISSLFLGYSNGYNFLKHKNDISIGDYALSSPDKHGISVGNIAIGKFAMETSATSGSYYFAYNIGIGSYAGARTALTTQSLGRNNINIGNGVTVGGSVNNRLNIGNLIYGISMKAYDSTSQVASATPVDSGKVGIGIAVPAHKLDIGGDLRIQTIEDGTGSDSLLVTESGVVKKIANTGGGGSSLFPTTGTGTATGDVTGDLDGNALHITQDGNNLLNISPSTFLTEIYATDGTAASGISSFGDGTGNNVFLDINTNDGLGNSTEINMDAPTNSITYTAGTHTFNGNTIFANNGTPASGKVPTGTDGAGNWTWETPSGGVVAGDTTTLNVHTNPYNDVRYLVQSRNLADLPSASTARTNIGLGSVDNTSDATKNSATVTLTNKTITSPIINGTASIGRPFITTGSTPSIAVGTGAGTGATASVTGNDAAGYITINTGTSPTVLGTIVTVTFANALTNTPTSIMLSPGNNYASLNYGKYYANQATASSSSFAIINNTATITTSATFIIYYTITQ